MQYTYVKIYYINSTVKIFYYDSSFEANCIAFIPIRISTIPNTNGHGWTFPKQSNKLRVGVIDVLPVCDGIIVFAVENDWRDTVLNAQKK